MDTTTATLPTIGTRANAFGATVVDLGLAGYLESEHLVSGDATGRDESASPERTAAFRTRMLVRRPIDASRFNGRVLVEWLNVSQGFDFSIGWPTVEPFAVREGWAWVGLTAQPVGVEFLRRWDPVRYGDLDHPWHADGDMPPFVIDETLSDGIFAAVGNALRADGEALFGSVPERLYGYGQSQSCGRIGGFLETVVNPTPDANPYDGFLMHAGGAGSMASMLGGGSATSPVESVAVPVMHVNSEWEALAGMPVPADNDHYRFWEVPGCGHGPRRASDWARKQRERDVASHAGPIGMAAPSMLHAQPVVSVEHAVCAALAHLDRWASGGAPPPSARRIEVAGKLEPETFRVGELTITRQRVELARDDHGNALGGVRLPHVEAPNGRHLASNEPEQFNQVGGFIPFTEAEMAALYPTPDAYAERLESSCNEAVKGGFLLPIDAEEIVRNAAASG